MFKLRERRPGSHVAHGCVAELAPDDERATCSKARLPHQNGSVTFYELNVPPALDDENRAAISAHAERLDAARECGDLSGVVGCAKELAESIARVVLEVRGQVLIDRSDFTRVIAAAHKAVERQPGEGLAGSDEAVRRMAQSAKGLVTELAQLRNAVGTGHGRAKLPPVVEEQARIATDATIVWARWMLGRLPSYLLSDVHDLIKHLGGRSFRKGLLTARLRAVDLPSLTPEDAQALGVAVGRRTVGETFLVRIEGVDPAIAYPERYPAAYRSGLVYGLLFNEQGALCTRAGAVSLVVDLLLVDDQLEARLREIAPLIESSGWIAPLLGSSTPTLAEVIEGALEAASRLPAEVRDTWTQAWER